MNKFRKSFLALAAGAMVLSSCNSDGPDVSKSSEKEGSFHATLTLSLPVGSRSSTLDPGEDEPDIPAKSDAGFEIGQDYENNVGSAIVLLASKKNGKYEYITSSLANEATPSTVTTSNPVYNLTFDNGALASYAEKEVYVFVYCNPTEALVTKIREIKANKGTEFTDLIGSAFDGDKYILDDVVTNTEGKEVGNFLMSNAVTYSTFLPSQEVMETSHDTPDKAFDLGTVKVERATARFDFKQTTYEGQTIPNLYPITDITGKTMAYVQLDKMALLNVANNYYYLLRVSDNGFNEGATICGQETSNNYVVSPYADQKASDPSLDLNWTKSNYHYTPVYTLLGEEGAKITAFDYRHLNYDALSKIGTAPEDNDADWNNAGEESKKGYHIWEYVTENTIPFYEYDDIVDYQRKGVTTGVVFKGHLEATNENSPLNDVIKKGEDVIYAYGNVIYGNLGMLEAAVKDNPVSALAETFKAAFGIEDLDAEGALDNLEDLKSTTLGGLTIYRPTDGQYDMYYSYWNRHNDNNKNTIMRSMEFSVVRNNVYKLSVQNIVSFGHPGDPGDDPDPDEPDDPDETPKIYFTVKVEVLPWVVRINDIIL